MVSENISSSRCPSCESEVLSALQKCWTGEAHLVLVPRAAAVCSIIYV